MIKYRHIFPSNWHIRRQEPFNLWGQIVLVKHEEYSIDHFELLYAYMATGVCVKGGGGGGSPNFGLYTTPPPRPPRAALEFEDIC
jgi:hypothetical protein